MLDKDFLKTMATYSITFEYDAGPSQRASKPSTSSGGPNRNKKVDNNQERPKKRPSTDPHTRLLGGTRYLEDTINIRLLDGSNISVSIIQGGPIFIAH